MQDQIRKAQAAVQAQKYAQAEQIYRELLQADSGNLSAFQGWAEMAFVMGNPQIAFALAQQFQSLNPSNADVLIIMARALMETGQLEQAFKCLNQAKTQTPERADITFYLGIVCAKSGNWPPAFDLLRSVENQFADHPEFTPSFTSALKTRCLSLFKEDPAQIEEDLLELALKWGQDDGDLLFVAARTKLRKADLVPALRLIERAHRLMPEALYIQATLGFVLDKLGWTHRAIGHLRPVYEAETTDENTLALIRCHERLDQYDQALSLLEDWEARQKGEHNYAWLEQKSRLLDMLNRTEDMRAVNELLHRFHPLKALNQEKFDPEMRYDDHILKQHHEDVAECTELSERAKAFTYLAIGQFYHRNKSFDKAMACFHDGHKMMALDEPERMVDELRDHQDSFSPELIKKRQAFGSQDASPIFIVGMPRSGTSLLEAMLARHSDIANAGELSFMLHAPKFFEKIEGLDAETSAYLSSAYLDRIDIHRHGKSKVVDKMPTNFRVLGLIACLFPKAKFLHATRHPAATCLSIYQQMFSGNHPYSHNLENLAHFYADHVDMMAFWKSRFADQIMEVNYETLVQAPEDTLKEVTGFLEVDWQEEMLQQSDKTVVRTASSWQVRQNIHTNAIESWRNYEKHLEPVLKILESRGIRV